MDIKSNVWSGAGVERILVGEMYTNLSCGDVEEVYSAEANLCIDEVEVF